MDRQRDELKVIIALGVIAAIGIIFQLEVMHVSVAHWAAASPLMKAILQYLKFTILVTFSGYVALLSLSISIRDNWDWKGGQEGLKWLADLCFAAGSFLLASSIPVYAVRVLFR